MMIHWCELCNNAPAEGVLEVVYDGDVEVSLMQACQNCVDQLEDDDWI